MKFTLAIFALVLTPQVFGQEKENPKSVFDIGLQFGYLSRIATYSTFQDHQWNKMTPGKANPDASDTSMNQYRNGGYLSGAPIIELSISKSLPISVFQQRNLSPMLMLTIGNGPGFYADTGWDKEERYRYDTLTSSHSGEQFFIDSVARHFVGKSYWAHTGAASLNFVVQTNREKQFSYLFGLGFYSAYGKGNVEYNERTESRALSSDDSTYYYYSGPTYYTFEPTGSDFVTYFDGPSIWQYGVKVPLGVDFRIGKENRPFLHRSVLGIQGSIDYRKTVIQDYLFFSKFSYSLSATIKYRFRD